MAFGKNFAELVGRLGADATINHLTSGGRVANLSIATDESYIDRNSGNKVDKTEWHRVVTFQDGLIGMLEKHAKKGRLIHVEGKMQTRKWRKERRGFRPLLDRDHRRAGPPGTVLRQAHNGNGAPTADAQAPMDGTAAQTAAPASPPADLDDEIPF